jgi:6-phosphofructokinase
VSQLGFGFPGTKIGVDQVQIGYAHIDAIALAVDRQVNSDLGFATAVVADNDYNSFNIDIHILKPAEVPYSPVHSSLKTYVCGA